MAIERGITSKQALETTAQLIATISDDHPQGQAEWMLAEILRVQRAQLWQFSDQSLSQEQASQLNDFLQRRLQYEPLQYILGSVEFRHLALKIDHRALIPRPETEGLVEIGLDLIKSKSNPKILDIGTGCGAIALSLLFERSGVTAIAVDCSEPTLALAAENAESLALSDRIHFIQADLSSEDFARNFNEPFDLIVTNPPYVSENEYQQLAPEIRLYEPAQALLAGVDGLDTLRRLAQTCGDMLKSSGHFISEIGEKQENEVLTIFRQNGWLTNVQKDLSGRPRYLVARRA